MEVLLLTESRDEVLLFLHLLLIDLFLFGHLLLGVEDELVDGFVEEIGGLV